MTDFIMPNQVTALPAEQQDAIRRVLIDSHLMTTSGEVAELTAANMPEKHKKAMEALGVDSFLGIKVKCAAARIGEAAAVAACASVPGGQIVIAACIAAAHEAANAACR